MKILVSGALGHIGSRVIRELPVMFPNSEFVLIDNMLTQRYASLFNLPQNGKFQFIEGDILKMELISVVDEVDVVLHLAAITDAANSFNNKSEVEKVNYNATVKIAEACSATKTPLIHISSTSVYGSQNDVVDENCSKSELQPQSPYAETKLKEESYLIDLGKKEKLRFIICRFGTICGTSPGMRFHTAVNKFCWQGIMQQPLTVWRTALHQKRPYLALEDAVNAIGFIIKNDLFDNNVYNILTDNLTVDSIVNMIKKHTRKLEIQYVDAAIMNQLSYEVLNQRIKNKGFVFVGSIKNSINETIELLEKSNDLASR
jgi:UDP-glucose 4-epimerase